MVLPCPITIDDKRLQAYIDIPAGAGLSADQLKAAIAGAGIRYGLIPTALAEATQSHELPQRITIAKALPPKQPSPAQIIWSKTKSHTPPKTVRERTIVGAIVPAKPGHGGMGVDGKPLVDQRILDMAAGPFPLERSDFVVDEKAIIALHTGVPICTDGVWSLKKALTPEANGSLPELPATTEKLETLAAQQVEVMTDYPITVAKNKLSAGLVVPPHHIIDVNALRAEMTKRNISHGIQQTIFEELKEPAAIERCINIAFGTQSIDGVDAEIECVFGQDLGPNANEIGSIDFKSLAQFREAAKGTILARFSEPTQGTPGSDIYGNKLTARDGTEIKMKYFAGEGTSLNGREIFAARDGIFHQDSNKIITIKEVLEVRGSVNLATGNITTSRPVHVSGDLCAGFSITSDGDVYIDGVVEDGAITVGGNLVVQGGILPGKEVIKVRGTCFANYARDRELVANSLVINKGIRHCRCYVERSLLSAEILGGQTIVGEEVTVQHLGNDKGETTDLQLAVDPELHRLTRLYKDPEQMGPTELLKWENDQKEVPEEEAIDAEQLWSDHRNTAYTLGKKALLHVQVAAYTGVEIHFGVFYHRKVHMRERPCIMRLVDGEIAAVATE